MPDAVILGDVCVQCSAYAIMIRFTTLLFFYALWPVGHLWGVVCLGTPSAYTRFKVGWEIISLNSCVMHYAIVSSFRFWVRRYVVCGVTLLFFSLW